MRIFKAACMATLMMSAAAVSARDLALIVDQQDYRSLSDLPRDARMEAMSNALDNAGFDVSSVKNATLSELRAAIFALETAAESEVDRLVIIIRGHVLSDTRQGWVLAQEARAPDRFDINSKAMPLPLFDTALRAAAGRALIAIVDDPRPLEDIEGLGHDDLIYTPVQGATLIEGDSRAVQSALRNLLAEGATTRQLAEAPGDIDVSGFISGTVAFTEVDFDASARADTQAVSESTSEQAYWNAARDIGTQNALNSYIEQYPNGQFVDDARRLMAQREASRETRLKEAEAALNLSRDQRRDVQRDLSLLGFDPRGIDGVFGPATRSAIRSWQAAQGREATGYLSRDQLQVMQEFAMRRAAELEEEARRRREIEEARDRAFWQDTGARNTEAGYRAYLKEFPDGVFAELAREELDAIESERRAEMDARERNAWDEARNQNTAESYRAFLQAHPEGVFAEAAQTRIDELTNEADDDEARARFQSAENAVAGSTAARLLIENRLQSLGLEPGKVDGAFDKDTRRALRRFQKARNLTVTGYMDQATMVQMLLGR
ncbi:peptidoglycan-binding domain-containing protein [Cognatishimia sp. SS12]|uniref:peptidoglycan-binding domain-containing protein n=1 Tax=Cognatishimia sp. SS12 TaxID=2979465 RepID=UPI00232F87D8|nr:peptidoglycan-binding domain-containing protein [Cognatishimia sp. SS12]MDC0738029.1 peptidoglycan-binding domain-containing protein [Cognatishimia sp. SS12]